MKNAHKISLALEQPNRKTQGTSAIHMSQVYQNCQRVWMGGPLVACWLKFSSFVGSRLKFSIFVGCRLISVNK